MRKLQHGKSAVDHFRKVQAIRRLTPFDGFVLGEAVGGLHGPRSLCIGRKSTGNAHGHAAARYERSVPPREPGVLDGDADSNLLNVGQLRHSAKNANAN